MEVTKRSETGLRGMIDDPPTSETGAPGVRLLSPLWLWAPQNKKQHQLCVCWFGFLELDSKRRKSVWGHDAMDPESIRKLVSGELFPGRNRHRNRNQNQSPAPHAPQWRLRRGHPLNEHKNIKALNRAIEKYMNAYNKKRLHSSIGYKTPNEVYYESTNNLDPEGVKLLPLVS